MKNFTGLESPNHLPASELALLRLVDCATSCKILQEVGALPRCWWVATVPEGAGGELLLGSDAPGHSVWMTTPDDAQMAYQGMRGVIGYPCLNALFCV